MTSGQSTSQAVTHEPFASWLVALSQRSVGRAVSAPTAEQMSTYVDVARGLTAPYRVADAIRAASRPGDQHKLRRVISGSQWDPRSLLLQAAREAVTGEAVEALALGAHTVQHGTHDDTILDLHAFTAAGDIVPVGWRRLRDEELRREGEVATELVDTAISGLALRPTVGGVAPPVICVDLLGDEELRAQLAALGAEYVIRMPADYARASLSVDPGTFWRTTSTLGYDLRDGARAHPVRLRDRPDTRVLDVGDEWACADPATEPPCCWIVHPVLRGGAASGRLRAARAGRRAAELAELRHRVPVASRAVQLGASLLDFDDPNGWERDCALRSLRLIFERAHV